MPLRLVLPLLLALSLTACATTEGDPGCPPPPAGSVYMDVLEFQQGLNEATRELDGEWAAGIAPIFQRLDKAIAGRERLAAERPEACRGEASAQVLRLRAVRARGVAFLGRVRQYRADNQAVLAKLAKRVPLEARLGHLRLRLVRIDDRAQRYTFRVRNLAKKTTHALATHRLVEVGGKPLARPAYFLLSDDLANAYRLMDVSPTSTADEPLTLRPGAEREIVVRFAGPFVAAAGKLTLQIDASLVPTDARHAHRGPATLVLPKSLLPAGAPPVFIAEPGRT